MWWFIILVIIIGIFFRANSNWQKYQSRTYQRSWPKWWPPRQSLVNRAYKKWLISNNWDFDKLSTKDKEVLHELAMGIHKKRKY